MWHVCMHDRCKRIFGKEFERWNVYIESSYSHRPRVLQLGEYWIVLTYFLWNVKIHSIGKFVHRCRSSKDKSSQFFCFAKTSSIAAFSRFSDGWNQDILHEDGIIILRSYAEQSKNLLYRIGKILFSRFYQIISFSFS